VFLAAAEQRKIGLFALMPKSAIEVAKADFVQKCAIVVGSEGRGVSERLSERATRVRIPTVGVESLNAALAAGIALFVARTQRMAAG
jgi:TrmH family RNA methyltransferase